jgi:hypothetical protein
MAITATAVVNNPNYKSWTVVCSDTDTTGSFAHGFASTPDAVLLVQTFFQGTTNPNWSYSVTGTTLTINKASAASSGGTTSGTTIVLKVVAMLPHSVMQ